MKAIYNKSENNIHVYSDREYLGALNSTAEWSLPHPLNNSLAIDRDSSTSASTLIFTFLVAPSETATVEVRRGHQLLTVGLTLPSVFKGAIRGLMGTFGGFPDIDLVARNGSVLPANASEQQVCCVRLEANNY